MSEGGSRTELLMGCEGSDQAERGVILDRDWAERDEKLDLDRAESG